MQWGFAFLLTFSYMFKTRSIAAKQAADAAKSNNDDDNSNNYGDDDDDYTAASSLLRIWLVRMMTGVADSSTASLSCNHHDDRDVMITKDNHIGGAH